MAEKLPMMQNLEIIDFGDCLMKTAGAKYIANALEDGHTKLQVSTSSYLVVLGVTMLLPVFILLMVARRCASAFTYL